MKRLKIDPQFLLSVAVFAILFGATYRDDASIVADSSFLDVIRSPFVAAVKSVSIFAFVLPVLATALILISRLPVRNVVGALTGILMMIALVLVLRMLPSAPQNSLKILTGSAVFALVVPLAMCTSAVRGRDAVPRGVLSGALAFALLHVVLNVVMAFAGQGFHSARFIGTTIHPNFIGVQMAGCAILFAGSFTRNVGRNAVMLIALASTLTLLVLTGSRTGLLSFGVGIVVLRVMRGLKLWQVALFVVFLPLLGSLVALYGGDAPDLQQFDRGDSGVNTRAGAWESMWAVINDAPLIGAGEFPVSSENSYLRGWATVGIFYVVAYLCFLLALFRSAIRLYQARQGSSDGAVFAALLFGLLTGAVLEGYLLDTLSFPVFVFILSALAIDGCTPGRTAARRLRPQRPPPKPAPSFVPPALRVLAPASPDS